MWLLIGYLSGAGATAAFVGYAFARAEMGTGELHVGRFALGLVFWPVVLPFLLAHALFWRG